MLQTLYFLELAELTEVCLGFEATDELGDGAGRNAMYTKLPPVPIKDRTLGTKGTQPAWISKKKQIDDKPPSETIAAHPTHLLLRL